MKDRKLAVRYARALLSVFPSAQAAEPADRFLSSLSRAMDESASFRNLMLNPAYSRAQRKSVLRALAERAAVSPLVANFLYTLVDHNRTGSLVSIAKVFTEEREREQGIVSAEITTAAPLPDDLRQRAEGAVSRLTGRSVQLLCRVEPSLLGGAVTRIGSTVYDGSLRTQLARLGRKMMTQE